MSDAAPARARTAAAARAPEPQRPSSAGLLQRKCACGQHTGGGECSECSKKKEGLLQRAATGPGAPGLAPPIVDEVLRTPGRPLDPATRTEMEPRFGGDFTRVRARGLAARLEIGEVDDVHEREAERLADRVAGGCASRDASGRPKAAHEDAPREAHPPAAQAMGGRDLSRVRVHADARAAESARAVGALAYTVGSHVVFAPGRYAPETPAGRRLLAHELAHVVQQEALPAALQRQAGPAAPPPDGGLSPEMLEQIARRLRAAMRGPGTDEEAIYSALSGRTQLQVDAIARVYEQLYGRSLRADLESELNESEMAKLAVFSPRPEAGAGALADQIAAQLDKAMDRIGTDEPAIFAALTGRTPDERREIKAAYKRLTRRELEADLRDELGGTDLTTALALLNQGLLAPEDELYLAMEGLGTDEETIFRVLEGMAGNAVALRTLEAEYRRKYGDLVQDLRGDLSGDDYQRVRRVLLPTIPDADVEDCDSSANPLQQPNTVREAHALAFTMLRNAIARSANAADPVVQSLAARYFKITLPPANPEMIILWAHVRRALSSMAAADEQAVYECEPVQSFWNGFCAANVVAVSLANIHLCPEWWISYPTVEERAGVLLHEWGHKFATGVNRIFETYCHAPEFAALPAAELVHLPDSYMGFAFELHLGRAMPCR